MIPETVSTGSWLFDDSDRIRYLAIYSSEKEKLRSLDSKSRTKGIVVMEDDPILCCAKMFSAIEDGVSVWMRSVSSHKETEVRFQEIFSETRESAICSLYVATGGTAGGLRFTRHTLKSMRAAVIGLQHRMGDAPLRSWCCLPLWHVAGLMQVFRAVFSDGDVVFGDYRDLMEEGFLREVLVDRFISLVPTQLARALDSSVAVSNLFRARVIFVGGGPLGATIAQRARDENLQVAPTYGTTETAGMITLLPPDLFLAGHEGVGSALPGTEVVVESDGSLRIRSGSLCLGYHNRNFDEGAWLQTPDFGSWDDEGSLHIEGRRDRIVNTGGVKVDPGKVENAILQTGLAKACLVTGVTDQEWGQRLVAFCCPSSVDPHLLAAALEKSLEKPSIPKLIIPVDYLPLTDLGKPDRQAITAMVNDS